MGFSGYFDNVLISFFSIMLSFIIPVYKTPLELLRHCLDSVLRYTGEMEVICILDSPGDPCESELEKYAVANAVVKLLKNERNMGVSYARNRGVSAARGRWIAFVDADDEIIADSYRQAFELCEHQSLNACVVAAFNEKINAYGVRYGDICIGNIRDEHTAETLAAAFCWAVYPMIIRREVWMDVVGGFKVGHKFCEDYMAVVKLLCADGDYAFLNVRGYIGVGHQDSACRSKKSAVNYLHSLTAIVSVLKDITDLGAAPGAHRWYLQHTIPLALFDPHVKDCVKGLDRVAYKRELAVFFDLVDGTSSQYFTVVASNIIRIIKKWPSLWFLPGLPFLLGLRVLCHWGFMMKQPEVSVEK